MAVPVKQRLPEDSNVRGSQTDFVAEVSPQEVNDSGAKSLIITRVRRCIQE
jgi:hypothetical protein